MRWISSVSMVAVSMAAMPVHAESKAEAELRRMDRDWAEFAVRGDVALFDRLTADDHVATHADGHLVTKAEEKAYIARSPERIAAITTDDVAIRVYGDTGVILGRVTVRTKKGNRNRFRYTTVWLKRGGRWRLIGEQHTRIEPPVAPANRRAEEVVRAYAQACNDFDLAGFLALHSPDVRKYRRSDESGKPTPGVRPGEFVLTTSSRDEVERKYAALFARTPRSVRVQIMGMISLGDLVLSRDRVTGFADGHVSDELTMYQVQGGLIRNIWYLERSVTGAAQR